MKTENYKDIPGYKGHYQVSNLGNVKSLKRKGCRKDRILKPCTRRGYFRVVLIKNNKPKKYSNHVLVAMAFLGFEPNGLKLVIDHINHKTKDNRLKNLRIVTQRENLSNRKKIGSSKYTGVFLQTNHNKWRSVININGKRKHLGYFNCEIKASQAYQEALNKLTNN
mgnify:CR=1 FL=1